MYAFDTSPLVNIAKNERKLYEERKKFKDDYLRCLIKEDQFLLSLVQQRKDDEKRCEKMKRDIDQTKEDIKYVSLSIANLEKENQNLRAQVKNINTVIQNKMIDENVNPRYKNVTRRTKILGAGDNSDAIKTTHKTIIHKLHLYKEYLGCNVMFEEPNFYVFTFLNAGQKEGYIKFQLDSKWTVVECKPENLLTEEDLNEFHKLQDTQKLISSVMLR